MIPNSYLLHSFPKTNSLPASSEKVYGTAIFEKGQNFGQLSGFYILTRRPDHIALSEKLLLSLAKEQISSFEDLLHMPYSANSNFCPESKNVLISFTISVT